MDTAHGEREKSPDGIVERENREVSAVPVCAKTLSPKGVFSLSVKCRLGKAVCGQRCPLVYSSINAFGMLYRRRSKAVADCYITF